MRGDPLIGLQFALRPTQSAYVTLWLELIEGILIKVGHFRI